MPSRPVRRAERAEHVSLRRRERSDGLEAGIGRTRSARQGRSTDDAGRPDQRSGSQPTGKMSSTPKQNKSSPARKDKSAPPVASSPAGAPGSVAPKTGMRRPPARKLFEADAKPFDEISTPEGRLSLRRWRVWSLVALATL